jgi:hypothetical protein
MKTRNALVSNSSSASFIILWKRIRGDNCTDKNLDDAFKGLQYDLSNITTLKTASTMLPDGIIKTKAWTSLMNSYADFGIEMLELHTMLTLRKNEFILVSAEIDNNG